MGQADGFGRVDDEAAGRPRMQVAEEAANDFIALREEDKGLERQQRLHEELLDKNQLYVSLWEFDDAQFKVSTEDKALNRAFHG